MVVGIDKAKYVLISACRNEANFVDGLIETVTRQSVKPFRFLIIDDGSTDDTYNRAENMQIEYSYLQISRMHSSKHRSFSSQVYAANYGYELIKQLEFEFIGFLDADMRLDNNYYERILEMFVADPKLGIAGGTVIDNYPDRLENIRQGSEEYHVAGGVQFFRRQCYEQIGGYLPIEGGGQDTIADVKAMMHGWLIRTMPDIKALHLRPEGYSGENVIKRGLKWGKKFYLIGYHPLFYLGQCLRRCFKRPILVGSIFQLIGYAIAFLSAESRPVSKEFVLFIRKMQLQRIRKISKLRTVGLRTLSLSII